MRYSLFSHCLIFLLVFGGCGLFRSNSEDDVYSGGELTEVTWELDRVERPAGNETFDPAPDQTFWVQFHDDDTFSGRDACNTCGDLGNGNAISISPFCTEIACGEPIPNGGFGQQLGAATNYEFDNEQLLIRFKLGDEKGILFLESK